MSSPSPSPSTRQRFSVDPIERHKVSQRSTWVSVLLNVVLTVVQFIVGSLSGSQALVADAIHSLSDLLSDAVVLVATRFSHKAADADHRYGHQRFETAACLAIGLLLLGVGVGMLWRSIQSLSTPEQLQQVDVLALWVALFTLCAKELLFRYLMAEARKVRSSLLASNAWHARSDAASSLVVALGIGGNLMGWIFLDAVAALFVGLMIMRMGVRYAWEALGDLMDRAASEQDMADIHEVLAGTQGVHGVHDVRTRKMGDMIMVDAHLEIDGSLSVWEGHQISEQARERVMAALPVVDVMLHLDPIDR